MESQLQSDLFVRMCLHEDPTLVVKPLLLSCISGTDFQRLIQLLQTTEEGCLSCVKHKMLACWIRYGVTDGVANCVCVLLQPVQ